MRWYHSTVLFTALLCLGALWSYQADKSIPIYFHVVLDDVGDVGIVAESTLQQQLDSLNGSFEDSGLAFHLAGLEYHRNTRWFDNLTVNDYDPLRDSMFEALSIEPGQMINVYTTRLSQDSFHGVSQFPDLDPETSTQNGILLDFRVLPGMGGKPNQPSSDEGDWLIHEMGHYFGLFHTFEAGPWVCSEIEKGDEPNCNSSGDFLCGTAPHLKPLPSQRSMCRQPACDVATGDDGRTDTANHNSNFMNYTSDVCRSEFTSDQRRRMLEVATSLRPILVANETINIDTFSDKKLNILSVYPNPAATTLTVEFYTAAPIPTHITVSDMLGRTVATYTVPSQPSGKQLKTLDLESLATGAYILTVQSNQSVSTQPILVTR